MEKAYSEPAPAINHELCRVRQEFFSEPEYRDPTYFFEFKLQIEVQH
jgi:hypothetical protein